jgi:hypothetical protein
MHLKRQQSFLGAIFIPQGLHFALLLLLLLKSLIKLGPISADSLYNMIRLGLHDRSYLPRLGP